MKTNCHDLVLTYCSGLFLEKEQEKFWEHFSECSLCQTLLQKEFHGETILFAWTKNEKTKWNPLPRNKAAGASSKIPPQIQIPEEWEKDLFLRLRHDPVDASLKIDLPDVPGKIRLTLSLLVYYEENENQDLFFGSDIVLGGNWSIPFPKWQSIWALELIYKQKEGESL